MATKFVSALTGPEMDQALTDMAYHNSEAYAVGTRNGVAVGSSDVTYHNNSKYWAEQVYGYTDRAEAAAERAEAAVPASTEGAVFFSTAQTLTTAQQEQAKANISAGSTNPNLLNNSFFTVNQRGVTSGTLTNAAVVGPDRWDLFQCSWSVANNAITLAWGGGGTAAGFLQRTGPEVGYALVGKKCTISAYVNGTLYAKTVEIKEPSYGAQDLLLGGGVNIRVITDALSGNRGVEVQFRTTSTTNITIGPVKMEVGSVSTLANDAPPDYGTELLKCMRYCQVYGRSGDATLNRYFTGFMTELSSGRAVFWSPLLVEMRANPTVANNGALGTRPVSVTQNLNGSVYTFSTSKTGIFIIDTNSNITTSNIYACATHNTGALLILSADL